jgi:hypothetical protein
MEPEHMTLLLTAAAQLDRRITVTAAVSALWFEVAGDLDPDDAYDVLLEHYAASQWPIVPAVLRDGVAALRARRLAALGREAEWMGDVDIDDATYQATRARRREDAMRRPASAPRRLEILGGQS